MIYKSHWYFLSHLVNWSFGWREEVQNRFSKYLPNGGRLGFPIRMISAIFDLQDTLILPIKFWVNWPFSSGEVQNRDFSKWQPWWPSWISDQNEFSYFWSTSHPDISYPVSSWLAVWFRRRSLKNRFSRWQPWQCTMDNGHWPITIAHLEHFVLMWANNRDRHHENKMPWLIFSAK